LENLPGRDFFCIFHLFYKFFVFLRAPLTHRFSQGER
jgi:hypothetical protein